MMDRDRAGRRRGRSRAGGRARDPRARSTRSRSALPRSSSSTTTPPRCRTAPCGTGIVQHGAGRADSAPAAMSAAPRAATSMRAATSPIRPMTSSRFEVPVLDEGDVNARVWIRIREVEQSLALIEQILDRLPARRDRAPTSPAPASARGHGAGRRLPRRRAGLAAARRRRARSRAAICATRPGSSGRCWKPRSRATSSPTSRSATNRSTAPIRGTTSEASHAQDAAREPDRTVR